MALRRISFKTRLHVLFQRPFVLLIGLFLAVLGSALTIGIISAIGPQHGEFTSEEYQTILEHGDTLVEQVYNIELENNIEINGKHPVTIYYEYLINDSIYSDYYQTLDNGKVRMLDDSDEVLVFKYRGQTVLGEYAPFKFPRWIIAIIPIIAGMVGLVLLFVVLIKSFIEIRFLRTANIKQARISYIIPQDKRRFLSMKPGLMIHYKFESVSGQIANGFSFTYDVMNFSTKAKGDVLAVFVSTRTDSKTQVISPNLAAQNGWELS